jgi:hypothetical protein
MTPAEERARAYAEKLADNDKVTVEVRVTEYEGTKFDDGEWMLAPMTSVGLTVVEKCVFGGHVHAQWITHHSVPGKPQSTQFLGGNYEFTVVGKRRRLRKSIPHFERILSVIVTDYKALSGSKVS